MDQQYDTLNGVLIIKRKNNLRTMQK